MKRVSLLLALLAFTLLSTTARGAQIWAEGVSESEGWIDYNKTQEESEDDELCWAASASNIIDYWQRHYHTPTGTPTGEAIWQTFIDSSRNVGGNYVYALQWWIGGDYQGITLNNDDENVDSTYIDNRAVIEHPLTDELGNPIDPAISTDLDSFGGFYWDTFTDNYEGVEYLNGKQAHLFNLLYGFDSYDTLSEKLVNQLTAPISLSISDGVILSHAITLWGLEYTETEGDIQITKLWITDSDDEALGLNTQGIFSVNTTVTEEGTIILSDYWATHFGDVYITEAFGINLSESDTWELTRVIPEPATATLSLLALAALCTRRRRR